MSEQRFQILSFDGGGLRGLFSAAVLAELEKDLGVVLTDHFDLIVGTSTGGLIALALGAGLRPPELVEFYVDRGPDVFGRGRSVIERSCRAKHRPERLRHALQDVFGDRTLGSSVKRLVIPSYSLDLHDVYLFKTPHHRDLVRDRYEKLVDVAMATTAAPTYLPAFRLRHNRLVDGGVWANNPSLVGVVEAVSLLGAELGDIRILSLGTTDEVTNLSSQLDHGGLLQWGRAGAGVLLRAQSMGAFHSVQHLVGKDRVARIDPRVPAGLFRLDKIDRDRVRGLAEGVSRIETRTVQPFLEHRAAPYLPVPVTPPRDD